MANTTIQYPMVNGFRHSFASIELKMAGQLFTGFKSVNYSRTRSRSLVRGNHPDPLGKTRGENEYKADVELYFAEWVLFMELLKQGAGGGGYGDKPFNVDVTYGESLFATTVDQLVGCTFDTTDASNGQGPDALTRKVELNPLKILFNGRDDLVNPLSPPAGS